MPTIRFSESFSRGIRKFAKNDIERTGAVKKTLRLFQQNPAHPSLRTEKLSGGEIWTIRVDKGNRLFFTWGEGDTAVFFWVGSHDAYRTMGK